MSDKVYTGTPTHNKSFYDKMDRERKEKEISDKDFFQVINKEWSEDILPEGERPKYDLSKTNEVIEDFMGDIELEIEGVMDAKCEYCGLRSHDTMVKQQKILNTMLSDIIQGELYEK